MLTNLRTVVHVLLILENFIRKIFSFKLAHLKIASSNILRHQARYAWSCGGVPTRLFFIYHSRSSSMRGWFTLRHVILSREAGLHCCTSSYHERLVYIAARHPITRGWFTLLHVILYHERLVYTAARHPINHERLVYTAARHPITRGWFTLLHVILSITRGWFTLLNVILSREAGLHCCTSSYQSREAGLHCCTSSYQSREAGLHCCTSSYLARLIKVDVHILL